MRQVPVQLSDVLSKDAPVRFVQWLVDNGDTVYQGERVAEVLSGGVLVYVVAPASGAMRRENLRPGTELPVAGSLGVIRADDEESAGD